METKAVAKPLRAAQNGSEPEQIGLAPEPEPLDQLSHWSQAMTTLLTAVQAAPAKSGHGMLVGSWSISGMGEWKEGTSSRLENVYKECSGGVKKQEWS